MSFQSPNPLRWLDALADSLEPRLSPPDWLTREANRRVLTLVNHVLMQEPAATERLRRKANSTIQMRWRAQQLSLRITSAGLFELCAGLTSADLSVELAQPAPSELASALMSGNKPSVRIEGDVQLAAELNWIADHVRWDLEHDLARLIGDAPAHTLASACRSVQPALRRFAASMPWRSSSEPRSG